MVPPRRRRALADTRPAAVLNVGSYWFSDTLVLKMYRAQPVGPEHPLSRIVARLTQRAGLPMPKVYVIPTNAMNAFATGRNPEHAAGAAGAVGAARGRGIGGRWTRCYARHVISGR